MRLGNKNVESLDLIGLAEAGIDMREGAEGSNHEAGADKENESERDLNDDEDAAGAMLFASLAVGAATLANAGAETNSGVLEDGDGAKENAGENGDDEGEEENGSVNADFVDARDSGRGHGDEGAQGGEGEAQANGAAKQAENETFQKQFTGDAVGAGAESGADGKFLAAAFDANEKEVGDIGAGDEQNHADGGHENPESAADIADDVLFEGAEIRDEMSIFKNFCAEAGRGGERGSNDGRHASYVRVGLLESDAGFEASESFVAEVAQEQFAAIPFEGEKERRFPPIEEMEAGWEDADDFARFAVDVEGLAEDGIRTAEPLLPIAVTEDDSVWRAWRIVLMGEEAAEGGGNAEKRESAVGDVEGVDLFGLGAADDAHGIAIVNANVLKRAILLPVDEVIGGSDVEILDVDAWSGEPDADEFVGARIGERF